MPRKTIRLFESLFLDMSRDLPERCPGCRKRVTRRMKVVQWCWHRVGFEGTLGKKLDGRGYDEPRGPRVEDDQFFPSEICCDCGEILASTDVNLDH